MLYIADIAGDEPLNRRVDWHAAGDVSRGLTMDTCVPHRQC